MRVPVIVSLLSASVTASGMNGCAPVRSAAAVDPVAEIRALEADLARALLAHDYTALRRN